MLNKSKVRFYDVKEKILSMYFLFFAVFPLLKIAFSNPGQVNFIDFFVVFVFTVCFSVFVWLLIVKLCANESKAGILMSSFFIIIFVFGFIHSNLEIYLLDQIEMGKTWNRIYIKWLNVGAWAAFFFVFSLIMIFLTKTSTNKLNILNKIFAYSGFSVVVFLFFSCVKFVEGHNNTNKLMSISRFSGKSISSLGYNPDVYYIILDGYARYDMLEKFYSFKNDKFIDDLNKLGFVFNHSGWTNYNWTFLSLCSSLNFSYIHEMDGGDLDPFSLDRSWVYTKVRDNDVAKFLKARGYKFIHGQSTWGATMENPYADEQISRPSTFLQNEYLKALWDASLLRTMQGRAGAALVKSHLNHFDALNKMHEKSGPKFVFSHFVLPHHPYLFDSNGKILKNPNISTQFQFQDRLWDEKEAYIEQLIFVNNKIAECVANIINKSDKKPIIIIQSDHGPSLTLGLGADDQFRVRFANFQAFYLPDAPQGLFPGGGTPVNIFPRIFNHYFESNIKLKNDRHFFSPFGAPFQLSEVKGLDSENSSRLQK